MTFTLDKYQIEKLREWQAKHTQIYTGPSCERYEYRFTPSTLGMFVSVYDFVTKEELDLTGDL